MKFIKLGMKTLKAQTFHWQWRILFITAKKIKFIIVTFIIVSLYYCLYIFIYHCPFLIILSQLVFILITVSLYLCLLIIVSIYHYHSLLSLFISVYPYHFLSILLSFIVSPFLGDSPKIWHTKRNYLINKYLKKIAFDFGRRKVLIRPQNVKHLDNFWHASWERVELAKNVHFRKLKLWLVGEVLEAMARTLEASLIFLIQENAVSKFLYNFLDRLRPYGVFCTISYVELTGSDHLVCYL